MLNSWDVWDILSWKEYVTPVFQRLRQKKMKCKEMLFVYYAITNET